MLSEIHEPGGAKGFASCFSEILVFVSEVVVEETFFQLAFLVFGTH